MKVKDHEELKSLQTQRERLQGSINELRGQATEINTALAKKKSKLADINEKIKRISEKDIIITEHAILRYIERVIGIDIEDLKKRILDDETKEAIKKLGGSGTYPAKEGHKVVLKKGSVVTVTKN